MPNAPDVGFQFGVEGDKALLSTINQLRTELAGLREEQEKLGNSGENAARGFRGIHDGAKETAHQMREAKGEAGLLGEAIGIKLPRHVRTFLAEIPGVGKLLAAAFSITAIGFLINALIELPGKIADIALALGGWTKAAKEAYEAQKDLNRLYLKNFEDLQDKKAHLPEAGLVGAAKTGTEIKDDAAELDNINKRILERQKQLGDLQKKIDETRRRHDPIEGSTSLIIADALNPLKDAEADRKTLKRLNDEVAELVKRKDELKQVTLPTKRKDLGIEQQKEAAELALGAAKDAEKRAVEQAKTELALKKAVADAGEVEDKREFDDGIITLEQYYERRKIAITSKGEAELKAVRDERAAVQAELDAVSRIPAGRTATEQRQHFSQIQDLTDRVSKLSADETVKTLAQGNELAKNEQERSKATEEHKRAELEMEKELATAEGSRTRVDKAEAELLELKVTDSLKQLGYAQARIDAILAEFRSAKASTTTGEAAQKSFEGTSTGLAARKDAIAEQVAAHQILPYQAAALLTAEYEKQIPMLRAQVLILREQAAAIQAAAAKRGETGPNALAEGLLKTADADDAKISKLEIEIGKMNLGWMEWKKTAEQAIDEVSTHVTTGLNGWITGHETFGQAIKKTWNSVVLTVLTSIEKIGAQFIAQHLKMLLFKTATDRAQTASTEATAAQGEAIQTQVGLSSRIEAAKTAAAHAFKSVFETVPFPLNLVLAPVAAAGVFATTLAFAEGGAVHAGGGAIRGPGSGTSDSIPILVSNGEHIMTAAASRAVGPGVLDAINRDPDGFSSALGTYARMSSPAPYSSDGFRRYAAGGSVDASSHGGDTHFHLPTHIGELKAWDGASVVEALQEHEGYLGQVAVAAVKRHFRSNGVG